MTHEEAVLASLSIMAIKPALVGYVTRSSIPVDVDLYERYYLTQQLNQMGIDVSRAEYFLDIIKGY